MLRCVNCSLALVHPVRRRQVEDGTDTMINILRSWITPSTLSANDFVCQQCFVLLQDQSINHWTGSAVVRAYGHKEVCLVCGTSILRARTHRVPLNSPERNVLMELIPIQQVNRLTKVCLPCWQSAYRSVRRHAQHDLNRQQEILHEAAAASPQDLEPTASRVASPIPIPPPMPTASRVASPIPIPPPMPTASRVASPIPIPPPVPAYQPYQIPQNNERVLKITSRIYKRAPATSRNCIFSNCQNMDRLLVPSVIKELLLLNHKLYVPASSRICSHHLNNGDWNELVFNYDDFTGCQMDEMMTILDRAGRRQLNFSNIREMNPHLCHYWLGMNSEQFEQLLSHVPQLAHQVPCPSVALGIMLVKLRTGDSNQRLSVLFNLARSTLETYMNKARNCLGNTFVPLYLGLGHISIQEVASRNKIIPEGLFGNSNLPVNNKPAIVICDGTYLYVQSSSNYSYQKKTYSLHKYTNLVKPFLVVCCDGFILQSLGPFPATESDSDIMSKEFHHENNPLRRYFRPDDVFILDRGFRDAVGPLQSYGFKVFMPETLLEGEMQLTTEQANKSRCVTMCRWVVEVVNGRIKRDFKLFRQEYFNRASTHLMIDFDIACALLNKFHPLIEDRPDAQQFLELAKSRLTLTNYLGEHIKSTNMNRRRAMFESIDSAHPHLDTFPKLSLHDLMTVALGSYQVKQARSYYGEHVRANGSYTVEIANNFEDDLPLILGTDKNLVRGRIKSRHTSGKTYYAYILVNRAATNSVTDISGYYCNCLVGSRTVGCCAHVMTILWFLSWARFRSVEAPARFLDSIFYEYFDYGNE